MDVLSAGQQLAAALIVGWLPGALILRAPVLDRHSRGTLDAEERVFWGAILSMGLSLSAVLALAAIGRYRFGHLIAVDLLISAAALALWRRRLRWPERKRASFTALIPIALVLLGIWRFSPPAEYIIGGKDPGTYMNEGIQLAQRGALIVRDETIAALPDAARQLFIPRYYEGPETPRSDYYSLRFMGFFVLDPESGAVVGQFPHLFPASIAVAYDIAGLTGARWTTSVWGMFGVLAVYFVGTRLLGRAAAASAAGLLALNVAQMWFARYPNSEVVMQALVFAALLANARAHVDGMRFFSPVAGALLGLLLFLRLDAVLAIIGVVAALTLASLTGRRTARSFWIALAAPAVLMVPYMVWPMRPYSFRYTDFVSNLSIVHWVAFAGALVSAFVIMAAAARSARIRQSVVTFIPLALIAFIVTAGLYALFLRHPGGRLAAHDAYALRTFANLYFTVPGVLAALLGFLLIARKHFWLDPAFFLTFALFATSVFYKIRIVPEHFWMARRFIPVILPGALLFFAAAAFSTAIGGWRSKALRGSIGAVLVLVLASAYIRASKPLEGYSEYEGIIPAIESLADRFGANDLVLVESRDAGGDVHVLATPLAYIYGKRVLVLASARPDRQAIAAFIEWARDRYDRVFFLGGGGTDLLSRSVHVRHVESTRFEAPEFPPNPDRLPIRSARKIIYSIYEFVDMQDADGGWFDLDVGSHDDLHVLRFASSELSEGRTFRWTSASSYITVPSVPATARELTLYMKDGGRPPAAPQARVAVLLDGEPLGDIEVQPGPFRPYTLPLPPERVRAAARAGEPLTLRLVSTLWNPHEVLGSPDTRDLGVMLDRVTIK